jgi:alginate O-acetyltransferase complex protein AlgI
MKVSDTLETVNTIFYRIGNFFGLESFWQILYGYRYVLLVMLAGYIIHWIPEFVKEKYRSWFSSQSYVTMGAITVVVVFILYQLMSGEMQPFIYFQF